MLRAKAAGLLRALRNVRTVLQGRVAYRKTGQAPPDTSQNLITLHRRTQNTSNDFLHRIVRAWNQSCALPGMSSVLGALDERGMESIADEVNRQGFDIFPDNAFEFVKTGK